MATSFCSPTSSLSSQFSGLRRLCLKLDPSPSHLLFQRQIDSHLHFSSTRRPSRGVVSMAGSGKVPSFLQIRERLIAWIRISYLLPRISDDVECKFLLKQLNIRNLVKQIEVDLKNAFFLVRVLLFLAFYSNDVAVFR